MNDANLMPDVRDLIADAIRQGGYKQATIARKAGMMPRRLSDTLHKRRRLDANELLPLCKALRITPDKLYGMGEVKIKDAEIKADMEKWTEKWEEEHPGIGIIEVS